MEKFALSLTLVMLVYYGLSQIYSDIRRIKTKVENLNHKAVLELQSRYKVNIRLFHTENKRHYGFAMSKAIYLSTQLLKSKSTKYKALNWVFHHEHYHLVHKHKQKTLLLRLLFSLTPLVLIYDKYIFLGVFVVFAFAMYYITEMYFEKKADSHANKMMEI